MRRVPLPGYEQPGLPVSMTVDRGIGEFANANREEC